MVRIYDATPLDVPAIVECMRAMHAESVTHSKYPFDEEEVSFILTSVLERREPSRQFLKVAKDDETKQLVGVLGAEVVDDMWTRSTVTSAHLIYVRPAYRGRVGHDLLNTYLHWAKRNADRIELQVTAGINNERAGGLIEAHGLQNRGAVYGMEF
jgi:GNAT superfamily N-acetyltransferase